jgi:hypothetical protein
VALATPAQAYLGGARTTVEADRSRFTASRKSIAGPGYTIDAMTLANGGTVKEFSGPDGMVFAVTWLAPGRPDLRQLFGANFSILQADNARSGPRTRAPLAVNRSDLLVESGGHSGAFWGVAILTRIAPADFSVSDLR